MDLHLEEVEIEVIIFWRESKAHRLKNQFWSKKETWELPELISSKRHTEPRATHMENSSKRNLETSRATPMHWANEKLPTSPIWILITTHLPVSPGKGPNYMLSQLFPEGPVSISLCQGADLDPPLWNTDRSWHILNILEPQKQRRNLGQ